MRSPTVSPSSGPTIIATGPLTGSKLAEAIAAETGSDALAFFDAIAPIVHRDSIDMDICWMAARWDKGGKDYINCPMNRAQYEAFIAALNAGEKTEFKEWEKDTPYFEGCMPIEVMAERGREYEVTQGLGWVPGDVERIAPTDADLKIPHMGWNTLDARRPHPVLHGIALGPQGLHAYFVHSFHLKPTVRSDLIAEAEYPKTWADLVRISQKLQKEGKVKWGFVGGLKYPHTWFTLLWSLWTNDCDLFSPYNERDNAVLAKNDWKSMLGEKCAREAIEFWWDNIKTHKIAPPGQPVVLQLDLHDRLGRAGAAGDAELLGERELDGAGAELHGREA